MFNAIGISIGVGSYHRISGDSGPSRTDPLSAVATGMVFDLDATLSASYGGSGQTLSNLIASPADGSAQSAYDFRLGTTNSPDTADPTFTGTANDAAAYFALDGGDTLQTPTAIASLPDFVKELHQSIDWTIGIAFRTAASGTEIIWSTTGAASSQGVFAYYDLGAGTINIGQNGGGGVNVASVGSMAADTDYLLILAHQDSDDAYRAWVNTTTAATGTFTFQASTSNPSGGFGVSGYQPSVGLPLGSGARVYGFYGLNEFIDDTKAAAIFTQLELRHNRDYTP